MPVVIGDATLPLTFTAAPASGTAPLATVLRLTTRDAAGQAVQYSIDFDDGTPLVTGQVTTPYPVTETAHTYGRPGTYRAKPR